MNWHCSDTTVISYACEDQYKCNVSRNRERKRESW